MKRTIELNQAGVDRLRSIVKDLRKEKASFCCPFWSFYTIGKESVITYPCTICQMLFPRISRPNGEIESCPHHDYSTSYLIKRLNEIIRYNNHLRSTVEQREVGKE